jgi:tetratricopeptide (TPR) repeat protein
MSHLTETEYLAQQGSLEKAILEYYRIYNIYPKGDIYHALGKVFWKQGNIEQAKASYLKALSIDKKLYKVYIDLGYLLVTNNNLNQAAEVYLQAILLNPEKWAAHDKIRRHSWNKNEKNILINGLKDVIASKPKSKLPYMTLSYLLSSQNKLDLANNFLQIASNNKALALNKNFNLNNSQVIEQRIPNFLIIGSGKSGTSSLYQYICGHPQVLPAITKEIGYFDINRRYRNGINWYLSHFPQIMEQDNFLTGEATPSYLYRYQVAERILQVFPQIKLIVILRNPIERAISAYYHAVKDQGELRSLENAIDEEIKILEEFTDPLEIMATKYKFNHRLEPKYIVWGLYYYFLKHWLELFPKKQLLILHSYELFNHPELTTNKVFSFLGLPNYRLEKYVKYTAGNYQAINSQLHQKLSSCFKVHNQKLESYLDIKFNWN